MSPKDKQARRHARKPRKPERSPFFKTLGVLGGMGPEATAYFLDLIVGNTAAAKDQEHVPVIVYSLPQIPHRTDAILHGGRSPLPMMKHGADILARAGADFLIMPCLTAHHFLPKLAAGRPIPFVDLIAEAAAEIRARRPHIRRIGLLATAGTIESRLFHEALEPSGTTVLTPSKKDMKRLMSAIYGKQGIKSGVTTGRPRQTVLAVAAALVRRGAQAIVAGCTEIPLVLQARDLPVPFIDPMRVGARACVLKAGGALRPARRPSSRNAPRSC